MTTDEAMKMIADAIKNNGASADQIAPYDQATFEDMIWDYCADHVNDDEWNGEWPEVDRETICYNAEKDIWMANCKFASDDHWYTLVGYSNGNVSLYY